ncbi:GntR family transcriptional regulator [Psychromarinibacter sp. S121]|uniref:GntR family transcriptional regulator n=1 Tax=Psychromarinibacter sp. S121 TaxID=3415127 RepID=UPI003C7E2A01
MRQRTGTIPLAQKVYDSLLSDLVGQHGRAGERLVEADIARDKDVSRTPVREALGRLESDGLIENAGRGGYIVISPSLDEIRDIFEIRRALEPMAFASVVRTADPSEDELFCSLYEAIQCADRPEDSAAANRALRAFWVERIRNRRLRETILRFYMQVHLVRAATLDSPEGRAAARAGTTRLADAYMARDPAAAQDAMAAFVDAALVFFERADAERRQRPANRSEAVG